MLKGNKQTSDQLKGWLQLEAVRRQYLKWVAAIVFDSIHRTYVFVSLGFIYFNQRSPRLFFRNVPQRTKYVSTATLNFQLIFLFVLVSLLVQNLVNFSFRRSSYYNKLSSNLLFFAAMFVLKQVYYSSLTEAFSVARPLSKQWNFHQGKYPKM